MRPTQLLLLLTPLLLLFSCNNDKLPVYGNKIPVPNADSLDYTLPAFSYLSQDSQVVDNSTVSNKIFITEFFFTSCPSICPKMQAQMLRVYEKYKDNKDVVILAFTIDPARDSVARLKKYEAKLGVQAPKWYFLTGAKDSIYATADNFLVSAAEDPDAPGGHVHSGNFILADKQRRLRGYYDGTKEESVQKLLDETDVLLKEK